MTVTIRGLCRDFGDRTAVNNLDAQMKEGEIFALLGHNGAGKTTTISMLTGLLEPTSGNAEVYGNKIADGMAPIHQLLGVCPQHDVLFDYLTTSEHIEFFARLKGEKDGPKP